MDISRAIKWNEEAGNKRGKIEPQLEIMMLQEELDEFEYASLDEDKVEMVDGLIDIIFVAIGTLHKLGLTLEQIEDCREEVCESNDSKLPFEKGEDGKVRKGKDFVPPNIDSIISRQV